MKAQWEHTYESTHMRAHISEHTGGKPITRPGSTLCASLRSRNAQGHVTRAILGNLQEKMWDPKHARAILGGNLQKKMSDPNSGTYVLRAPAQSKRAWACHKSRFVLKFTGKMPDPNSAEYVLSTPAQSKRTWTFHKSFLCDNL